MGNRNPKRRSRRRRHQAPPPHCVREVGHAVVTYADGRTENVPVRILSTTTGYFEVLVDMNATPPSAMSITWVER